MNGAAKFFIIEKSEETTFKFDFLWTSYKKGSAKDFKFVKQSWKWVFKIFNKKMVRYWQFLTKSIKSSLCNYSDAYILVTGNIDFKNDDNADLTAASRTYFENFAPFKKSKTEINENFVDEA